MEKQDYQYENAVINFDEEEAEDVTEEMRAICMIKYRDAIRKVLKIKDKNLYKIYFCEFYTAFGQSVRYARRKTEVQWYSKIATEEKESGKTYKDYVQEFIKNKIQFDGVHIPIFIDTIKE